MRERACRDQEVSHRFQVKWLKVVHMPFMIFDQEGFYTLTGNSFNRP